MAEGTSVSKRYRFSVPNEDESTQRWLDAQQNLSLSLRLIVRKQIEREGYIDVACRPVEQLPRRGRPPGSVSEADPAELGSESVQEQAPQAREPEPELEPTPAASDPQRRKKVQMDIQNLLDQTEEM